MNNPTLPLLMLAFALTLSACTWVELTPSGEKARILTPMEVENCPKVGTTTVQTQDTVGEVVYRSKEKVAQELEILARNAAEELGGDTVVPVSEIEAGQQTFAVYKCIP